MAYKGQIKRYTREQLKEMQPEWAAPTGRVTSWLNDKTGLRRVASCTNIRLEVTEQLDETIKRVSQFLRGNAGVAINVRNSLVFPPPMSVKPRYSFILPGEKPGAKSGYKIVVGDTMEHDPLLTINGILSIEDSWLSFMSALKTGHHVTVDLTRLRPAGTPSKKGITASGAESFKIIYDKLAEYVEKPSLITFMKVVDSLTHVLCRGGLYKNGATTFFVNANHPETLNFLNLPIKEVMKTKRAVYLSRAWMDDESLTPVIERVIECYSSGSIFIANRDYIGDEYDTQVCLEIRFKGKLEYLGKNNLAGKTKRLYQYYAATCTLGMFNLGLVTMENIHRLPDQFAATAEWMVMLHQNSGIGRHIGHLNPSEDMQVGQGLIGFSNMLVNCRVKYAAVAKAMTDVVKRQGKPKKGKTTKAETIAQYLWEAYRRAAEVYHFFGYYAAFTFAPNQTSAMRYKDVNGFHCSRNIEPPYGVFEDTASQVTDVKQVAEYPEQVEIFEDVGYEPYRQLAVAFQRMWEYFGLAHLQSHNIPNTVKIDREWIDKWLNELGSGYYIVDVRTNNYKKTGIDPKFAGQLAELASCGLEACEACEEG